MGTGAIAPWPPFSVPTSRGHLWSRPLCKTKVDINRDRRRLVHFTIFFYQKRSAVGHVVQLHFWTLKYGAYFLFHFGLFCTKNVGIQSLHYDAIVHNICTESIWKTIWRDWLSDCHSQSWASAGGGGECPPPGIWKWWRYILSPPCKIP